MYQYAYQMQHNLSLTSLFHKCSTMSQFKQAHARLLVAGMSHPPSALRPLFSFSALHPCGDIDYALLLLRRTQTSTTLFPFNTLIRGFARRGGLDSVTNCVFVFNQLNIFGLLPNNFTFTFLFQCCSESLELYLGLQFHSLVVKNSFGADLFVRNSMIQFYSVCEKLCNARRIFDESADLDVVSWNSLINGYIKNGEILEAFELFGRMPERNEVSWNSLMTGLVRFGHLDEASQLFYEMPNRNFVSWIVIISGYSQNGCPAEALELFRDMQFVGLEPNAAILVSVLSAVSQLGSLTHGKWVHSYIQKKQVKIDSKLSAALIDMYAKCGSIALAMQVFGSSPEKGIYSYTAAISGLAISGRGEESVQLFEQMKGEGITPDPISYIAVLCACTHMGWVEKGFYYFNSMSKEHGIEPGLDHYACMVDLLGRAGLLVEAEKYIASMPIEPDNVIWGTLLASCRLHNNPEMAQRVGNFLIESDPHHDGRYVLLSNIYAESNRGDEAEEVRRSMRGRRIKRVPGCSSIEVDGVIHEFVAGDRSHEKSDEIYLMLGETVRELRHIR